MQYKINIFKKFSGYFHSIQFKILAYWSILAFMPKSYNNNQNLFEPIIAMKISQSVFLSVFNIVFPNSFFGKA